MNALISPRERVQLVDGAIGARVAQVEATTFEVALPLFWVDCPDECVAGLWYYDETSGMCKPAPEPEPEPITPVEVMP